MRARGAGEGGPRRLGSLQAGELVAGGAGCSRDTGEEAGQPFGADPQGKAVVKLDRRGPEGQGDVRPKPFSRQRQAARNRPSMASGSAWPCRLIQSRAPRPARISAGP